MADRPPRQTSRRDFLRGRSAAEALAAAADSAQPAAPPSKPSPPQSLLLSVTRDAMACEFEILLSGRHYPQGADAAVAALDLVDALEAQLTVYRDTSEVSRLNAAAGAAPVVVEERLFGLFQLAQQLSRDTAGAFDITAGPLSKVWGFYRRQGQMPDQAAVAEALSRVGFQQLELDESQYSVQFLRDGMEINLGAIGKGYALDRAGDLLLSHGVADYLIHGGNSSVLACGSRSPSLAAGATETGSDPSAGWTVGLRHPLRPSERLAEFCLCEQALGTSGSGSQYFHHAGKRYGHILDPRTGWPAEQVLSSTVVAPTAALADALSTAFYVLGVEEATKFCDEHPTISALLVTQSPRGAAVDLHPINLKEDAWQRTNL